jgi:hypothetical protein
MSISTAVKTLGILFLSMVLTSCASIGGDYHVDVSEGSAVTIKKTFVRFGSLRWNSVALHSVNGKLVRPGLLTAPDYTMLAPGKSNIVAVVMYNNGGSAPSAAEVPMEVELLPGLTYEVQGSVSGSMVEVWLALASTKEKTSRSFFSSGKALMTTPILIRQ